MTDPTCDHSNIRPIGIKFSSPDSIDLGGDAVIDAICRGCNASVEAIYTCVGMTVEGVHYDYEGEII